MRKESVDVDILVAPKNSDRKNQFDQFWRTSTKVIPIEKTKLATFQERQQVKDQQPLDICFCSLPK